MNESPQSTYSSKVPAWLDKEYVNKIIKHYSNNPEVVIKNFTISPFTSKGENYYGELNLLTIDYSLGINIVENMTFILKTRLENEYMSNLGEDFDVFGREVQYYKVINVEIQRLLDEIKDTTAFSPK